jgi:hypothetical protein
VDEGATLGQVLREEGHVVPGLPLFWVLARDTTYRERFLAERVQR